MATNIATLKPEAVTKELAVKKLMEACEKDPKLQAELFRAPKELATKYGVTLEPEEEKQLKRVGELMRIINDFTEARIFGPGPIFYPVDLWWKRTLFDHIYRYEPLYNKLFHRPLPGYPADLRMREQLREQEMGGLFTTLRKE